jgi:hypothetical protein
LVLDPPLSATSIGPDYILPGGRVVRRGADRLDLFPGSNNRFPWLPLAACLTLIVLASIAGFAEWGGPFTVAVLVAAATLFGLLIFAKLAAQRRPLARFDRRSGQFTYCAPTDAHTFPLDAIVAIQTLRFVQTRAFGAEDREAWELNIALGGPKPKRLCLACGGVEDRRSPGRQLADFLGVPLVSHLITSARVFDVSEFDGRGPDAHANRAETLTRTAESAAPFAVSSMQELLSQATRLPERLRSAGERTSG